MTRSPPAHLPNNKSCPLRAKTMLDRTPVRIPVVLRPSLDLGFRCEYLSCSFDSRRLELNDERLADGMQLEGNTWTSIIDRFVASDARWALQRRGTLTGTQRRISVPCRGSALSRAVAPGHRGTTTWCAISETCMELRSRRRP